MPEMRYEWRPSRHGPFYKSNDRVIIVWFVPGYYRLVRSGLAAAATPDSERLHRQHRTTRGTLSTSLSDKIVLSNEIC